MFFFVMKRAALPVEFLKYLEFLYQGVPPSHKYTILMKKPCLKKSFAKFLSHGLQQLLPFQCPTLSKALNIYSVFVKTLSL